MRIGPHGDPECPGEPKVCQLQIVAFVDKKILWLEIAMEDTMGVAIEKAGG
jgi:hypothetical protein